MRNYWIVKPKVKKNIERELDIAYSSYDFIDPKYIKGYTDAMVQVMKWTITKKHWKENMKG